MTSPAPATLASLPGYPGESLNAPRPWRQDDSDREWWFDFHFPRGAVPLSMHLATAALVRSTAVGAAGITGGESAGLDCRTVGTYVYTAGIAATPSTRPSLDRRFAACRDYAGGFAEQWDQQSRGILALLAPHESQTPSTLHDRELLVAFRDASAAFGDAWTVHFSVMYRLLEVHAVFKEVVTDIGLDSTAILRAMPSERSTLTESQLEMQGLADTARSELSGEFTSFTGQRLLDRLRGTRAGRQWLTAFSGFLVAYGRRGDSVIDLDGQAWIDDPIRPLSMISDIVAGRTARTAAPATRSFDDARFTSGLGPAARRRLSDAITMIRRADFTWWNEDHNHFIDLRAHLPVRQLGLEAGRRFLRSPRAGLMLFDHEFASLCTGETAPSDLSPRVADRREMHAGYIDRRNDMPVRIAGRQAVGDPVLLHILGDDNHSTGDGVEDMVAGTTLRGIGVVDGVVRGRARHVSVPADARRLAPGDVLVSRGTTPAWSDVLERATACVSETGGPLSHMAIECRASETIAVVGVRGATRVPEGAWIEVDGTAGTVSLI